MDEIIKKVDEVLAREMTQTPIPEHKEAPKIADDRVYGAIRKKLVEHSKQVATGRGLSAPDINCLYTAAVTMIADARVSSRLMGMEDAEKAYGDEAFTALEAKLAIYEQALREIRNAKFQNRSQYEDLAGQALEEVSKI